MIKESFRYAIIVAATCLFASPAWACDEPATVCLQAKPAAFPLIAGGRPATVLADRNADPAVQRVATSFAGDLLRVSGRRAAQAAARDEVSGPVVLIGVHGDSPLLDELVQAGKLDLDDLDGQWEAFRIEVVENPWPTVPQALVIAGSDRRGAVFGAYDLSERMGVSPWHWFADVPVARASDVFVTAGERHEQPGVRYRGIFINDEAPAFSSWSQRQFGGA